MEVDLQNTLRTNSQHLKRTWMQRTYDPSDAVATMSNKVFKHSGDELALDAERKNTFSVSGLDQKNTMLHSICSPGGLSFNLQPEHSATCHCPTFQDEPFERASKQNENHTITRDEYFPQQHVRKIDILPSSSHAAGSNGIHCSYDQFYVSPKQLQSVTQGGNISSQCPECAAGKPGHIGHIGRSQQMDTS